LVEATRRSRQTGPGRPPRGSVSRAQLGGTVRRGSSLSASFAESHAFTTGQRNYKDCLDGYQVLRGKHFKRNRLQGRLDLL